MPPELPLHLTLTGRPLLLYPPVAPELHQRLQAAYAPRASRLLNRFERRKAKKKESKSASAPIQAAGTSRRFALSTAPETVRHEPFIEHITISGPLLNKAEMWGETVCIDGYDRIEAAIGRAAHDVDCAGILLEIDSPGGMVSGCFELSDKIRDWAQDKPIIVHTSGLLCSAAYALASGATEIFGQMTALIGSIGVVYGRYDFTGFNEKHGVKIDFLKSGDQKTWGNPDTKMDEAEREAHQAEIMALAEMFFDRVAQGRDIDAEAVRNLQAGTFLTGKAIAHGLATSEGDLAAALSRLSELALNPVTQDQEQASARQASPETLPGHADDLNPVANTTITPAETDVTNGPADSTKQEKPMSKLTRVALAGQLSAVAMMMAMNAMEEDEKSALDEDELEAAIAEASEDEVEAMDDEDVTAMDDEDKSALEEDDIEMIDEDEDSNEAKTFAATASRISRKAVAKLSASSAPEPTGDPVKDAVLADRKRAADIKALPEAKGREALADHFAATDMSVADAKAALSAAPKDKKGTRLSSVHNPDIGTGAGKKISASKAADDVLAKIQNERRAKVSGR